MKKQFLTGAYYRGGQTVTVPTELDKIPLFVRAGAEIPVTDDPIEYADRSCTVKYLSFPERA